MMTCQQILQTFPDEARAALHPPFVEACANRSIEAQQFDTWLQQDYHFVRALEQLAQQVLSSAPQQHASVLAGGISALADELKWFADMASERGLSLESPLNATCAAYIDMMGGFEKAPYAVQAAAFWAIEYVYNQAWQLAGPLPEPYRECAERWGNPEFTKYVGALEHQADEALSSANQEDNAAASEAVVNVLEIEEKFWQMANGI